MLVHHQIIHRTKSNQINQVEGDMAAILMQ